MKKNSQVVKMWMILLYMSHKIHGVAVIHPNTRGFNPSCDTSSFTFSVALNICRKMKRSYLYHAGFKRYNLCKMFTTL